MLVVSFAIARPAFAQRDVAAEAEALFREGKRLLELQDFAHACPKLAESYRLDPATGALLALAVCHEGEGRTATAWAEYGDVAARSKAEGRSDREHAAREKIAALGANLSMLTISVASDVAAIDGFRVKRDGAEIGPAIWGVAIPVDPGTHTVEAAAVGKQAWQATITIGARADKKAVEVPKLTELIGDNVPGIGATARPAITVAGSPAPLATPAPTAALTTSAGSPVTSTRPTASRLATVAIATIMAGGVSLGVGGYFVDRALSKKSAYQSDPACAYDCAALDAANSAGNAATGFIAAGLVLVGGGIALYELAPRLETSKVSLRIAPVVTASDWQLAAVGRF